MGWLDRRKRIIDMIKRTLITIHEKEDSADENILVADVCQKFSASRRTVLEYLKELELTGFCRREGGIIWLHEKVMEDWHKKKEEEVNKIIGDNQEENPSFSP